ncbi:hypothetical protein CR513_40137, partial [Mucuna pruriens]
MKKQCPKYAAWCVKKGKFLALITIENWISLDLFETFVVPSFRRNLISISSLNKFGFSCSFGNNKVSLYQNSNVVSSDFLVDNLYMLNVVCSHNEILQIGHTSKQRIQRLMLDEILKPLDLSNFKVSIKCIKGK